MRAHEEYDKIAVVIDSGVRNTVASARSSSRVQPRRQQHHAHCSCQKRGSKQRISSVLRYIRVFDDHRKVSWAKFQMCKGLGSNKMLGSISRLLESGHPVVFRDPGEGKYTENTSNCYRTYLRQQQVSYFCALWVKRDFGANVFCFGGPCDEWQTRNRPQ